MFKVALLCALAALVAGHGRLISPASRASAWRFGFETPPNYNDNQLFCGGFSHQVSLGGKCGTCGDPYDRDREHEAGGRYATGTITGTYTEGQVMVIGVDLTANHKGWFEFRLCPVDDYKTPATQECLDRYLLPLADGSGTRVTIYPEMKHVETPVVLPRGLVCAQCVLQWKYNTGNSWGTDPVTGESGIGLGAQEQFYGCSDITILPANGDVPPAPELPTTKAPTAAPTRPPTQPPSTQSPPGGSCTYQAVGDWKGNTAMDNWCVMNCAKNHCPSDLCACL